MSQLTSIKQERQG